MADLAAGRRPVPAGDLGAAAPRLPGAERLGAAARRRESARRDAMNGDEGADEPVESVGEAVLELLQSGDGSLAALDVPELEPLDGLVAVVEVDAPLDLGGLRRDRRRRPVRAGGRPTAWSAASTSSRSSTSTTTRSTRRRGGSATRPGQRRVGSSAGGRRPARSSAASVRRRIRRRTRGGFGWNSAGRGAP